MVCICIGAVGVFLVKKMFLAVYNVVVFQDFGLKTDPTHTQQVLPSHGSKLDSIVRHITYTAVVLHHGFNGILDGQLRQS